MSDAGEPRWIVIDATGHDSPEAWVFDSEADAMVFSCEQIEQYADDVSAVYVIKEGTR